MGAVNNFAVEHSYTIHDVVVFSVLRQVVAAYHALWRFTDDCFGVVAARGRDFGAETCLLLEVGLGVVGVQLVLCNVAQPFGELLPSFVVDASIAFDVFRTGTAVEANGLAGAVRYADAGNVLFNFCFRLAMAVCFWCQ